MQSLYLQSNNIIKTRTSKTIRCQIKIKINVGFTLKYNGTVSIYWVFFSQDKMENKYKI